MKYLTIIIEFLMTLSSPVAAQNFAKGVNAVLAGDYAAALKEFMPLAEAGDSSAQTELANMYMKGKGVPQNYKKGFRWFKLAAAQGDRIAQGSLAFMHFEGQGALQDNIMAHMWWNIAAANGDETGGTNRNIIAKEMTAAAIQEAQAMARKCMSSDYKECGY